MNEQIKYETIKYLADHPNANKDRAALTLNCTRRHINRMLAGYKKHGKEFFVHGNRGRKPATTIPVQSRQAIVDLYRNKYFNANFQHFTELLAKHEQIHVSASSVAAILESEYILSPKVTKAKQKRLKKALQAAKLAAPTQKEADTIQANLVAVEDAHSRRPRCAFFGELIQMDASSHEWIPGQVWHLHLAIDDATGRIVGAWFDTQETLPAYYHVFHQILTTYGIPYKILTDRRTVFTYKKKNSPSIDEDTYTQFAYACKQLGVLLESTNEKFSLPIHDSKSAFEKQPSFEELNRILAVLTERTVDCGHSVLFMHDHYRMLNSRGRQVHYCKGTKVMVIKAFDGNLFCSVNDKDVYALEKIPKRADKSPDLDNDYQEPKPRKTYIPSMSHPWRRNEFHKFVRSQPHHFEDSAELPA